MGNINFKFNVPLMEQLLTAIEKEIKRLDAEIENYWNCNSLKDTRARVRCWGKSGEGLRKMMWRRERLHEELDIYRQMYYMYKEQLERIVNLRSEMHVDK